MQFSNEIIKIIDEVAKRLGVVVDWTSANVTPYIQTLLTRIVQYELWTSVTWIALSLSILIPSLYFCKYLFKRDEMDADLIAVVIVIEACIVITAVVVTLCQIFDIVTCLCLPEKIYFHFFQDITKLL